MPSAKLNTQQRNLLNSYHAVMNSTKPASFHGSQEPIHVLNAGMLLADLGFPPIVKVCETVISYSCSAQNEK